MPPEASIIIRTLNEGKHLEKLLIAITEQTYTDWEMILVDSGSTDNTVQIAQKYTDNIYHMRKEDFTFGKSLNIGCDKATGKYLVFVSAHIYPLSNTWLSNLIKPLEDPQVGMVYGSQRVGPENSIAEERSLLANFINTSQIMIDEPAGHNGNSAIRRNLWAKYHFDERLTGLEDMAWAKLIQRDGFRVYYSAGARIVHIHEESLKQVYRRFFREALAYKYIFPSYRLNRVDAAKMLCHWILGDILYCLKHPTSLPKWARIIPERYLESTGKYNGNHYHTKLKRKFLQNELSSNTFREASNKQTIDTKEYGTKTVLIKLAYVNILKPSYITPETDQRVNIAYSGIVLASNKNTDNVSVGDKIIGTNVSNSDTQFSVDNFPSYKNGKLLIPASRYVHVSPDDIHKIPDEITLREGPSIVYLGMCMQLLDQIKFRVHSTACVVGSGLVGSLLSQMLSNNGIKVTVISDNPYQNALLWKYDVNTMQETPELSTFDYLINTTEIAHWSRLLISQKGEHAIVIQLGTDKSLDIDTHNNPNRFISVSDTTQKSCDNASSNVMRSRVDLSDYTDSVFELDNNLPISSEEKPPMNVLVEISKDLTYV